MAQNNKLVKDLEESLHIAEHQEKESTKRAAYGISCCNKLRAEARLLTEGLRAIHDKNKAVANKCNKLLASRGKWRAKVLPYRKKEINRNLAKLSRPTLKRGLTFKANIRYMYYRLFNCRVSEL